MPKGQALLAALPVAALLLAGCSGDAPAPPPAFGPDGTPVDDGVLALPAWELGDWWTYGIEVGPGEESATTYVVTQDNGNDWWMDTDSPERAFQDARSDISRLGPQRKGDLAGSQGSDRVEFFRWPLTANATWTTRWDGQDVAVAVDAVDAQGAVLTARNATHLVYTYRYSAGAGWFQQLDRHAPDGSVAFTLLLLDHGSLWTGTAVRWTLTPLVHTQGTVSPSLTMVEPTVEVPAGATDLWLTYTMRCAASGGGAGYTIAVAAHPPNQGEWRESAQCVGDLALAAAIVEAPAAGTWSFTYLLGGGPEPPTYAIELLARTRTDLPVG